MRSLQRRKRIAFLPKHDVWIVCQVESSIVLLSYMTKRNVSAATGSRYGRIEHACLTVAEARMLRLLCCHHWIFFISHHSAHHTGRRAAGERRRQSSQSWKDCRLLSYIAWFTAWTHCSGDIISSRMSLPEPFNASPITS